MNQLRVLFLWSCVALLMMTPNPAHAQTTSATPADHGYVNLDFGVQAKSQTLSTTGEFPLYDETASFAYQAKAKSGALMNIEGGVRTWHDLFVGVAYTHRFKTTQDSSMTASVPHPLFFDTPRETTSTVSGLEHTEYGVHFSVGWRFDVGDRADVRLFGGPSLFGVSQQLVESFDVQEAGPPFTTVSVANITTTRESKTAAGIHIGLDGTYTITRRFGVGVLIRYGHGSVKLPTPGGGTISLDAGGFEAGFGVRMRF